MSSSEKIYDVIIVGAASAGLTAAMYTARQGMKTLVVSKDMGGQLLLESVVQNYPGYLSIDGYSLMAKFEEQAKNFGAEVVYDEVLEVGEEDGCFTVKTPNRQFQSRTLILAFGKSPRDLGVRGEDKFKGRGVSYCATCDGPLYRGRTVAVVGSSEQAVDAAVMLSDIASKVYMVSLRERPVGHEDLLKLLEKRANVTLISNSKVVEVKGDQFVEYIAYSNTKTGAKEEVKVDGVFVELGYVAKTVFVKDFVQLNERGEIIVDKKCATSRRGVFAAGDVTDVPYKQAIIAAGQGCIAALSAYNYIRRLEGKSAIKADWITKKLK